MESESTRTTGATAPSTAAPAKPNGPVAAVLLATGIGSFVLGVLTTWAEASTSFKETLQLNDRVGPLSGKTIVAVAAFVVSWAVLGAALRHRDVAWRTAIGALIVLVVLGIIGTFPTFFQEFTAAE